MNIPTIITQSGALRGGLCAYLKVKYQQREAERHGWSLEVADVFGLCQRDDVVLIDLRDAKERAQHGVLAGALHVPFDELHTALAVDGQLSRLAHLKGKCVVFICAAGWRSAQAVHAAQKAGIENSFHMKGGLSAWREEADLPVAA